MVRVVTDSSSSLPPEFIQQHNIKVVPLKIQLGDETFAEGPGINIRDFFQRVAASKAFPGTSQPALADFEQAYRQILLKEPTADILVLTVTSKLSGTYNTALAAAAQFPQASIMVFDTLSVAMGVGLMVMTATRLADEGWNLPDIISQLDYIRQNLPIFLTVADLEFLRRGGRIGTAAAFLGGLLDTKPILTLTDGEICPVARVRGKKKALHRLFTELEQRLPSPDYPVQAGVMHAAAADEAHQLGQMIRNHFNVTYFFVFEVGPALGAHVGPGMVGTGFCPEIP
jgi:DegV family protein with EDD domain